MNRIKHYVRLRGLSKGCVVVELILRVADARTAAILKQEITIRYESGSASSAVTFHLCDNHVRCVAVLAHLGPVVEVLAAAKITGCGVPVPDFKHV